MKIIVVPLIVILWISAAAIFLSVLLVLWICWEVAIFLVAGVVLGGDALLRRTRE